MLVVLIGGGLGNQLFQYAYMRHLEELKFPNVRIHTGWYQLPNPKSDSAESHTARVFDLDKFQVKYQIATPEEMQQTDVMIAEGENYSDLLLFGKNARISGYWQSIEYLAYVHESLRTDCCLRPEYISDAMRQTVSRMEQSASSVSLHIRRGDYLSETYSRIFESCPMEYYERAVRYLTETCGHKPSLFVFSDDREWAEKHMHGFCGCDTVIMKTGPAYEDLYLMSHCRHNIIANSSFSWWGTFLNVHESHITIAPKKWYKDRPNPDLYYPDWITF